MKRFLILLITAAVLFVSCASTSGVEGEVKEKNFTAYYKNTAMYCKGSSSLRERFNYYNETLFNSELRVDHIGFFMYDEVDLGGFYSWNNDNQNICIVINYHNNSPVPEDYPYTIEQMYDMVLLHEMTHAWRYQVMDSVPVEKEDGHDKLFRNKIYELKSATKLPLNFR